MDHYATFRPTFSPVLLLSSSTDCSIAPKMPWAPASGSRTVNREPSPSRESTSSLPRIARTSSRASNARIDDFDAGMKTIGSDAQYHRDIAFARIDPVLDKVNQDLFQRFSMGRNDTFLTLGDQHRILFAELR
jgi:hypothetical protein